MTLSKLATAIYDHLRAMLPSDQTFIGYQQLIDQIGPLPPPNHNLHARDSRLNDALDELVIACRNHGLPAIAAIVVQAEQLIPGVGYFKTAYPQLQKEDERLSAWIEEVQAVCKTGYPPKL